jgi:RNA polymerase sporulation-specific sigma factor
LEIKKYDNQTEENIVKLAGAGDEVALEFIYLKYRDIIKSKANLYFLMGGSKDDLIQEGMIGLFGAVMRYDADKNASFRTFAEMCIEHNMVNAVKASARIKHSPLNAFVSIYADPNDEGEYEKLEAQLEDKSMGTPEDLILLQDQFEYINKSSAKIFSKLERIVWREFLKGRTYTEIAEVLGKSPKSIDNSIQRIRKKIEKYLSLY